jgi:hypothetical protein
LEVDIGIQKPGDSGLPFARNESFESVFGVKVFGLASVLADVMFICGTRIVVEIN